MDTKARAKGKVDTKEKAHTKDSHHTKEETAKAKAKVRKDLATSVANQDTLPGTARKKTYSKARAIIAAIGGTNGRIANTEKEAKE